MRLWAPLLVALLLAACGGKKAAPVEKLRPVKVVRAVEKSLPRTVIAVGTLGAMERADLSFKVPGRLMRLHVDIGSRVLRGAVLAELEERDYALRLERVRAALEQARARLGLSPKGESDDVVPESTAVVRQYRAKLEQANAQLVRIRALLGEGLVSRSTYDVAEADQKVAESQYNDALEEVSNRRGLLAEKRSDVALARQQLHDAALRAPFDGSVQQRKANLGEYLVEGAPVLTLVKMSPIRLRIDVPEREARAVRRGQAVLVHVEGDVRTYAGTVARVSPALEESNRSLIVEAEIPNPRGELKPGSFARAEIQTESADRVVVVPASAVVTFAGIEKILTVKDQKALERPVVTGRRGGELVEIVSGIQVGEPVVTRPGNLSTGTPVAPEEERPAPSSQSAAP